MRKMKALCYVNQFFAGLGGEEKAHEGLQIFTGPKGPGIGMEAIWADKMGIAITFSCGDNFINLDENFETVKDRILAIAEEVAPDVFIAGPAFNSGRYGVACAKICDLISSETGIPSITGLFPTNPAVEMYLGKVLMAEATETAAGMRESLSALAPLAYKIAIGERLAPADVDRYIPTGIRINELDENSAAYRVVDMLLKKIKGKPYVTEIPLRKEERVAAAPALKDTSSVRLGLITTGGLVIKGNPDNIRTFAAISYGAYPIDLATFDGEHYESIHGGYDTAAVNRDPQRLIPFKAIFDLQKRGLIGSVTPYFLSTSGIGTNVGMSKQLGAEMAKQLKDDNVQAVLLTST
jgi:glycine reductase